MIFMIFSHHLHWEGWWIDWQRNKTYLIWTCRLIVEHGLEEYFARVGIDFVVGLLVFKTKTHFPIVNWIIAIGGVDLEEFGADFDVFAEWNINPLVAHHWRIIVHISHFYFDGVIGASRWGFVSFFWETTTKIANRFRPSLELTSWLAVFLWNSTSVMGRWF